MEPLFNAPQSARIAYASVFAAVLLAGLPCRPCLAADNAAAVNDVAAPDIAAALDDEPRYEELQFESTVDEYIPTRAEYVDEREAGRDASSSYRPAYLAENAANERLIDRTTDPTAWLMDLRYRHQWNWPVHADDPDSQALQIRPTIPFRAWGQVNLLRVTVPYNIENGDGAGIGDLQILDLIVFQERWGRWGVGPSIQITPHSTSGDGTFQAGPAAGAVAKNKHWTVGVLTQNYFADGVAESRIQPILAHKFDDRWALGIGDSEFRYDWEDATWTQLPLGVELDRITDVWGQKIQLFANPQFNFQRDSSNSGWTIFVGLTMLMPEA